MKTEQTKKTRQMANVKIARGRKWGKLPGGGKRGKGGKHFDRMVLPLLPHIGISLPLNEQSIV